MTKITLIEHNGTEHGIEVAAGQSVMNAAMAHNVPGIDADCGGACACATCQVYVDAAWLDRTGTPSEEESAMLEFASHVQPNSRLSCQIVVTESLDGLVVRLPKTQH